MLFNVESSACTPPSIRSADFLAGSAQVDSSQKTSSVSRKFVNLTGIFVDCKYVFPSARAPPSIRSADFLAASVQVEFVWKEDRIQTFLAMKFTTQHVLY